MSEESTQIGQQQPRPRWRISERTLDAIQDAVDAGVFDNLPGRGKPLDLSDDDNPFVPDDMRLAYHILRNAGYSVPWIGEGKEIENQRQALERELRRQETRLWEGLQALERIPAYLRPARLERLNAEKREFATRFKRSVATLNRRIDNYNLSVPTTSLQTSRYDGHRSVAGLEQFLE